MKKIFVIVAKDVRRVRPYLAVWLLAVAAKLALVINEISGSPIGFDVIQNLGRIFGFVEGASMFLVVGVIVQEDGLVGARGFWHTRPIAGWRLLAAKTIAVGGVTMLLPGVLYTIWWLGLGFSARSLGWSVVEFEATQIPLIAIAGMMATLTDTLIRFLVWSAVLAVAFITGPLLWSGTLLPGRSSSPGVQLSWFWVVAMILTLTAVAVIVVQYLTRRLVAAVAILCGGVVLAGRIGASWSTDLFAIINERAAAGEWRADLGRSVTIKPISAERDRSPQSKSQDADVLIDLDVSGVERGLQLSAPHGRAELDWPTGLKMRTDVSASVRFDIDSYRSALGLRKPVVTDETGPWWRAYGEQMNRAFRANHPEIRTFPIRAMPPAQIDFSLRRGVVDLINMLRPDLSAKTTFTLSRPVVAFELPVRRDAHRIAGGFGVRILTVEQKTRAFRPSRLVPTPADPPPQRWTAGTGIAIEPSWRGNWLHASGVRAADPIMSGRIIAVNRSTGEFLGFVDGERTQINLAGVTFAGLGGAFRQAFVRRDGRWIPIDPQFEDHLSFAVIVFEPIARFSRQVTIDHLQLTDWPPPGK